LELLPHNDSMTASTKISKGTMKCQPAQNALFLLLDALQYDVVVDPI
jgi:hypothetical protein